MQVSGLQREPADISNVVMAIKCGASDTISGMASNCVIGYVADKLVDLGATVVFGETTEFLGGEHILARRAVGGPDGPAGKKIFEIVNNMEQRAALLGEDMRGGQRGRLLLRAVRARGDPHSCAAGSAGNAASG